MAAGEELARRIKNAKPKEQELADLVYGVVTSTSPLKVYIDNRFPVGSDHLILSQMVRDLTVSVSVTVDGKHGSGSAQVFRSLRVGDRVTMLRISHGQQFYVLERS